MRGNTKKFALKVAVAAAATAAMVVPMAACGSGTAGGGKTKISFYSYFKDNQIGEVVKGFEKKNPDITLRRAVWPGSGTVHLDTANPSCWWQAADHLQSDDG